MAHYSPEQIARYQEAHFRAFGYELSLEDATKEAIAFYTFVRTIYVPLTNEERAAAADLLQRASKSLSN